MPSNPSPRSAPSTGLLALSGPIAEDDVARLVERLTAVIHSSDAPTIVCDVRQLPASIRTIEALARLQLTARRHARRIRLRRASPELVQLLELVGLADVVSARRGNGRDPEQRVHPLRVEERVDGGDPAV